MAGREDDVDRLLRRFGAAVRTFTLYRPPHPATAEAVREVYAQFSQYTEAYGRLSVRVARHGVAVDSVHLDGTAHARLAMHFYTRKIAMITVLPTATEEEVKSLLTVVSTEPGSLLAGGGAEHLLWKSGVGSILLDELALSHDEEQEILGLNAFNALLGRGRLSPQERALVMDILRAGPGEVGTLLENLHAMIGETTASAPGEDRLRQLGEALASLDGLIRDEPAEDQSQLYANLTEACFVVPEPLRHALQHVLSGHAREDGPAADIVNHFSAQQLVQIVMGTLARDHFGAQLAEFLQALAPDRDKAGQVLSLLETQLEQAGAAQPDLAAAVWLRVEPAFASRPAPAPAPGGVVEVAVSDAEIERLREEAHGVDDAAVAREAARALVAVFDQMDDGPELTDITDALHEYFAVLVEQRDFAFLAAMLGIVREIADASDRARADLAAEALKSLAHPRPLRTMLLVLAERSDQAVERDVQACLAAAAGELVSPIVRLLGAEPNAGMRALLCDVLSQIGRDYVDEIGQYSTDMRWYLVRNVANVLGRTGGPRAVAYLAGLARHPEYRVRREAVTALVRIGTPDARAALAAFVADENEDVALRALKSLGDDEARRAIPRLLVILNQRDPAYRLHDLKQAVIETLEHLGDPEALAVLDRLAQSRLVLTRRSRQLRALAQRAAAAIRDRARAGGAPDSGEPVAARPR